MRVKKVDATTTKKKTKKTNSLRCHCYGDRRKGAPASAGLRMCLILIETRRRCVCMEIRGSAVSLSFVFSPSDGEKAKIRT